MTRLSPQEILRKAGIRFVSNAPNGRYRETCKQCGKPNLNVKYDRITADYLCADCGWSGPERTPIEAATILRHRLAAAGYCPIPLYGKEPPVYEKNNPRKGLAGWQNLTAVTTAQVDLWERTWPDAVNTGVLTRSVPTLDLDILDEDAARACEDLVREHYEEAGYVLTRIGKPPKRAIPFRSDEPFNKIVANLIAPNGSEGQKIEFLADGQQVVVAGIHPDTQQPYRWHGGEPGKITRSELPYIREADAQALVEQIVELLARDFGYTRVAGRPGKSGNGGDRGAGGADWKYLLDNIHAGRELHESLRNLAAKMVKAGTDAGAVVNQLRALMESSSAPRDERWQERYDDIPRLVKSAEALGEPQPDPGRGGGGGGPGDGGPQPDPDPEPDPDPKPKQKPKRKQADEAELLAELNRDNCVVLDGGKVMVLRFEKTEHEAGGERYVYFVPTFLTFQACRDLYLNRHINVGKTFIDLGSWWLTHPQRRQYRGLIFRPGDDRRVIDGCFNLWTGWGVTPKRGDWGLLRNHLREVLAAGNEEVDRYNYNWLAWSVQNPGQQATVAPVFIGDPGTGKGTLGNALCRIFGQHALHISSAEDLHGKFNDHLRQCCFLFGDECYAPQDRRAEGQVKRMITESTLMIEPKGRGKFRVPNLLHVMLASNHEWVVPAGAHERRYVVERVAETHRQDPEWFGPIYKQMQNGGYEAMLFELLHVDLGDWHPRQIVHTAALAEQQEESLSPLDAWWLYKRPSSPVPTISTRIEPRPTATKSKSSNATATAAPTAASASARAPFGATGSTIRPAASRPGSK